MTPRQLTGRGTEYIWNDNINTDPIIRLHLNMTTIDILTQIRVSGSTSGTTSEALALLSVDKSHLLTQ
jgi:hypothetical protein